MNSDVAFIFDLDGTLWDARKEITESWREKAIEVFGHSDIDEELISSVLGLTMEEITERISPADATPEEKSKFASLAFTYENEYLAIHPGKPYEGVLETLTELRRRGHGLYIVSNCQKGYIENFTKLLYPFEFDGFLCFGDTGREKSFTIRALISKFGLRSALYVGDTAGDEKATRGAGIPFVHASYGFGKCEKPDCVISSFAELLNL